MSEASIMSVHKGVEGGKGLHFKSARREIIGVYWFLSGWYRAKTRYTETIWLTLRDHAPIYMYHWLTRSQPSEKAEHHHSSLP